MDYLSPLNRQTLEFEPAAILEHEEAESLKRKLFVMIWSWLAAVSHAQTFEYQSFSQRRKEN
jgi:hypothetical protein